MTVELLQGDCLERMKEIEAGSVDMVLTDPPYGTMNGAGIDGWEGNKTAWDTVIDREKMLNECNRVLRTNGALVLFSQEPYTSHLITNQHGNLPFSYRMVWLKDHFANSLIAKKAPVNYTEDVCVFFKKYPTTNTHPLANIVKEAQIKTGRFWNGELADIYVKEGWSKSISNAKAVLKHSLNWNYVQFGAPSAQQHNRLEGLLPIPSLEDMQRIDKAHKLKTCRTFNLPEGKKYKSNVLEYRKDYTGHHPTQKPVALLEDLIKTYTNLSDNVLDFTMGSGSTGVACVNTDRNFIGIELDPEYFAIAEKRITGETE